MQIDDFIALLCSHLSRSAAFAALIQVLSLVKSWIVGDKKACGGVLGLDSGYEIHALLGLFKKRGMNILEK